MFEEIADPRPTALDRLRSIVARVVRADAGRYPLGVGCMVLGLGSIGISGGLWAARPAPSMELPQAAFTIEQLIETKDKVLDYESEPEGELVLSGKEASFVLADNLKYDVWIETRGHELFVQAAVPYEGDLCFNVEFQGSVTVEDGQATVVPTSIYVNGLNIGPFLTGRELRAHPEDLWTPDAQKLLRQTRSLRVADDRIYVAVDDPRSLRL